LNPPQETRGKPLFITEAYQPEKLERYARIVMQKGKLNYGIIRVV
jgi:hypothetical protein